MALQFEIDSFESRVTDRLSAISCLASRARVGVAFSGGSDSTALLAVLQKVRPDLSLLACHIDHGLAHASEMAENACSIATSLDISCLVMETVVTAGKKGWEAAAREARYRALGFARQACALDVIVTGHTMDDRAETFLLHLLRGSGIDGLSSLRFCHGGIVRPLLGVSRGETRAYCVARGLVPFEDPTNQDLRFRRNYIRSEVLPRLDSMHPGAAKRISAAAERLDADRLLVEDIATTVWGDNPDLVERGRGWVGFDFLRMGELARPVAVRIVQWSLADALQGWSLSASAIEQVLCGQQGQISGTHLDSRREGQFFVVREKCVVDTLPKFSVEDTGLYEEVGFSLDVRCLQVPFLVRPLRRGDRLAGHSQTVLAELAGAGVARRYREQAFVVEGEDSLLGIVGEGVPSWTVPEIDMTLSVSDYLGFYVAPSRSNSCQCVLSSRTSRNLFSSSGRVRDPFSGENPISSDVFSGAISENVGDSL